MTVVKNFFLIAAVFLMAFITVINLIANVKYKNRMKSGGRKPLFLAYSVFLMYLLITIFCVLICILDFKGIITVDMITAIFIMLAVLSCYLFLMFRRSISEGLTHMIERGEHMKLTRNQIMANVSHEIRTPMNTIVGLTEVLKNDDSLSFHAKENLENISAASATLLGVVNNLIDFSKIESNKLDIIENEYSVEEMVRTILGKAKGMLGDRTVELISDIGSDVPSFLYGDDIRIIQAITNILSNACKYTNVGVITFKLSYEPINSDSINLKFDIEDTGIGIPYEDQCNVFNSCLNNTDKSSSSLHGSGLGLLITKSIVDKIGGTITFESTPGVGSNFHVSFIQAVRDSSPIGSLKIDNQKTSEEHYSFTAPMAKVLVVDDNIVNLFVAKEILSNYQMEIQTASSGQECLDLVDENYYDLIFMDYVMPEMDGHETLLKLRQPEGEYFRKIPVVALTAQLASGGQKLYLEEGFQGYLAKPINVGEVEAVLKQFLPEEYICYKEGTPVNEDCPLEEKAWYKRFSKVLNNFDLTKGLESCNNDYTSYLNLLRVIYNDSFTTTRKLTEYLEAGDFENYRITVHSMKAVTASAGALQLSFICQEHENAAKDSNIEYLKNHIDTLSSEYESFLSSIDVLLQRESEMMARGLTSHKEDKSAEELDKLKESLLKAINDFDIDAADEVIKEFDHCNLSFEQNKTINDVKALLMLFKYDEAADLIEKEFGE